MAYIIKVSVTLSSTTRLQFSHPVSSGNTPWACSVTPCNTQLPGAWSPSSLCWCILHPRYAFTSGPSTATPSSLPGYPGPDVIFPTSEPSQLCTIPFLIVLTSYLTYIFIAHTPMQYVYLITGVSKISDRHNWRRKDSCPENLGLEASPPTSQLLPWQTSWSAT